MKPPAERLKQAAYDLDSADHLHAGGRHFHAVFMAPLAVEKGLKGLYTHRLGKEPPKTHNLVYLLKESGVEPAEVLGRFLVKLNTASIDTRYPEALDELEQNFSPEVTSELLKQAREAVVWISEQF